MMNSQNDFAFIILKLNTVIYSSIMKQFCKESLSSTHLISRVIPFEDDDPSKTNMGMSLFNRWELNEVCTMYIDIYVVI